jgi:hypothetical protein
MANQAATSATHVQHRPNDRSSSPLVLTAHVLDRAAAFFEERGTFGLEGTAMIKRGDGLELVVPHQVAQRDALGRVSVEVPREGQIDLARALGPDEIYVARIHSHPGDAFHSPADDANPVILFEGGLSIVVPFYGLGLRRGLQTCAVYLFSQGAWVELPAGPSREAWIVQEQPT